MSNCHVKHSGRGIRKAEHGGWLSENSPPAARNLVDAGNIAGVYRASQAVYIAVYTVTRGRHHVAGIDGAASFWLWKKIRVDVSEGDV